MKTKITKEILEKAGWSKGNDPATLFIKHIGDQSEDNAISLIIHGYYNSPTFGVLFPNGDILNLKAEWMEDLEYIESNIVSYDTAH